MFSEAEIEVSFNDAYPYKKNETLKVPLIGSSPVYCFASGEKCKSVEVSFQSQSCTNNYARKKFGSRGNPCIPFVQVE